MLSKTRESKIRQRLKDCGGINGWNIALEKLEQSAFLNGTKTEFKANIDFILQESSFIKLMEGNYDNNEKLNNNTKNTTLTNKENLDEQVRQYKIKHGMDG